MYFLNVRSAALVLAAVAGTAILAACDPSGQAKSDAMRFNKLNSAFYSRERRGDAVRAYVPYTANLAPLGGYRDLRVGSAFSERERHYSYKYSIQSIERDGVTIAYWGRESGPQGDSGDVSGTVRLKWRSRPTPTPLPRR